GQLYGERRGMAHLPGRLRRDLPDREGAGHKLVPADVADAVVGTAEALFCKDQEVFVDVPQPRRLGRLPRTPGAAAAGSLALAPDDLARRQETQLHVDGVKVGVKRDVRLAAQVG